MDTAPQIRDFLLTRRAKVTPEQVGLPRGTATRRVPGLRREKVAALAGVSTEWYTRLEKGHIAEVSEDVLHAVARALQLDEAETTHLFDLARSARAARRSRRPQAAVEHPQVKNSLQRLLDSMTGAAAFIRDARLDVLAANALARALYHPVYEQARSDHRAPNLARFAFLDPRARSYYPDWEHLVRSTVAVLRTEAGRAPHDTALSDLVGELSVRSEDFRELWASHDVLLHRRGVKCFAHPVVGRLEVEFDSLEVTADRRLTLTAYSAVPSSPSEDALRVLASWAATEGSPSAPGDLHDVPSSPSVGR